METIYAVLLLSAADAELNEANLTSVLEAAGHSVTVSRVRALIAALEGVDVAGDIGGAPANEGRAPARETPASAQGTAAVDADDDPGVTEDRSTATDTDEVS